jgi:hypothetical protein
MCKGLKSTVLIVVPLLTSGALGWELKLESSLQKKPSPTTAQTSASAADIVFRFFDDAYAPGGFQYAYPEKSKVFIAEGIAKSGEVSLQFDLTPDDFSGGSVCLYNMAFDLKPYYKKGVLRFWIKSAEGKEIAWAGLVDNEKDDLHKTVVRLPTDAYGGITSEWTLMSMPLCHFGLRGVYWDVKKKLEVQDDFDWDRVTEFRIEIKKKDNKKFRVWVDDIVIVKNCYDPAKDKRGSIDNILPLFASQ